MYHIVFFWCLAVKSLQPSALRSISLIQFTPYVVKGAGTFRLRGRFLTTTLILGRLGSSGGSTTGALACGDMASEGERSLYPLCGVPAWSGRITRLEACHVSYPNSRCPDVHDFQYLCRTAHGVYQHPWLLSLAFYSCVCARDHGLLRMMAAGVRQRVGMP